MKKTIRCGRTKECICSQHVTHRLSHYLPMLEELHKADPKTRATMIKKAPTCMIRLLSEAGLNVLKGKIRLTDDQYKKLRPHKRLLLSVSRPGIGIQFRRQALAKKQGGFLPVVLPILLSAISGFAGQTLAKAVGFS